MRSAIIFLDWDTARRLGPRPSIATKDLKRAAREVEGVFNALQPVVAAHLKSVDAKTPFRVRWRLYHGWYTGTSKTDDMRAVEQYRLVARSTVIDLVSFGADIEIADRMLCAGPRMPLFDTLRSQIDGDPGALRQKMVDTGLVGDLLWSVRSAKDDIHVVIGDDDDLLPGIFMADQWGAKVHMLRRQAGSRHLKTAGLVTILPDRNAA
ncbi:hypothetical protein [Caulobacter sp. DWR2-3-1b2]|uniref:hypothetical protein n=2 Tax=unclassified Caulobacter TaxID=2648921 RepID=UPI003CEBBC29